MGGLRGAALAPRPPDRRGTGGRPADRGRLPHARGPTRRLPRRTPPAAGAWHGPATIMKFGAILFALALLVSWSSSALHILRSHQPMYPLPRRAPAGPPRPQIGRAH